MVFFWFFGIIITTSFVATTCFLQLLTIAGRGGQPPRYTYKVDDPNHLQMQFATLVNGLIKRYSNRGNNPAKGYIILFLDVSCT